MLYEYPVLTHGPSAKPSALRILPFLILFSIPHFLVIRAEDANASIFADSPALFFQPGAFLASLLEPRAQDDS
jgi:hypothetical protein